MNFLYGFLSAWLLLDVVLAIADSFPFRESGICLDKGWGLYIVMLPLMPILPVLWIIGRIRVLVWKTFHKQKTSKREGD